jgi:hypothetical protein
MIRKIISTKDIKSLEIKPKMKCRHIIYLKPTIWDYMNGCKEDGFYYRCNYGKTFIGEEVDLENRVVENNIVYQPEHIVVTYWNGDIEKIFAPMNELQKTLDEIKLKEGFDNIEIVNNNIT